MSQDALPAVRQREALTPGSLRVIRYSAAWLGRRQEAFIRQLDDDLGALTAGSAVPPSFDRAAFTERMVQTLLWTALTEQPQHVVVDTLHQVGAQNWAQGFPDAEYANFAHALMQTLRFLTGDDWSTSTGSAWISLCMWLKPHLLAGAQQAAAQQAAAAEAAAREVAARRAAAYEEAARVAALVRDSQASHTLVAVSRTGGAASLREDGSEWALRLGQMALKMARNSLGHSHGHRARNGWSAAFSHHDLLSRFGVSRR